MKKIISLLLILVMTFSTTIYTFASSDNTSYVVQVALKEIVKVNNLTESQTETLEPIITEKIKSMSEKEQQELLKEMRNLEKSYDEQIKSNDTKYKEINTDIKKEVDSMVNSNLVASSTADDAVIEFIYVGTSMARLTGWMMMCNAEGLEVIEVAIAGGAVGAGLATILVYAAGYVVTPFGAAIAATIGTYIAAQVFFIKAQLLYSDYAVIYI